jgi:hypothetical protein
VRGTLRQLEDDNGQPYEERLLLLKRMLYDDEGRQLDASQLGLSHAEVALVNRYI